MQKNQSYLPAFEIKRKKRRSIGIRVEVDGKVVVSAPLRISKDYIDILVNRKMPWIIRRKEFLRKCIFLNGSQSFTSGELHYYLGGQYPISIIAAKTKSVSLVSGILQIALNRSFSNSAVKTVLEDWYTKQAIALFGDRLKYFLSIFDYPHKKNVQLKTRFMKRLWGSCSRAGVINLNTNLIKIPLELIDYVIMHEICHLAVMGHNRAFYNLLFRYMPDWKSREEKLKLYICS